MHTGWLFPGLTGFGAARLVLGYLSFPVILAHLTLTLVFAALVTRNFTDFLQDIFFQVTPGPVLGGAVLLVAAYQADRGIEGLARVSQLLLAPSLAFLAAMYITGMTNVQPHFLTQHAPSLTASIGSTLGAFYLFLNV